jgi:hypothetical protein
MPRYPMIIADPPWRYGGTDQEPWTPIPWTAPSLAEALAHMGAIHDRHRGQWGARAHQLNV